MLPAIVGILRDETAMDAGLGLARRRRRERARRGRHRGRIARPACPGIYNVLQRTPDETPARWSRVHQPAAARAAAARRHGGLPGPDRGRRPGVRLDLGACGIATAASRTGPRRGCSSAAADQIGQALAQDRLAAEAQAAEIARQSDALKSALLQSVSHDLRTPLATIRAAAGTLRPGSGLSAEDQQESADAIDREVEYLNRLVTNLLDLSRIEAGALRAERDVFELDDLVGRTIERLRRAARRPAAEIELDARRRWRSTRCSSTRR